MLWNRQARRATLVGFTTFDRAATIVEASTTRVSAWTDFEGLPLAPGAAIATESLLIGEATGPAALVDTWTAAAERHYAPVLPPATPAARPRNS